MDERSGSKQGVGLVYSSVQCSNGSSGPAAVDELSFLCISELDIRLLL